MSEDDHPDGGPEVEEIAERYLDRLHAGGEPDPSSILSSHPGIAAALARRIRAIDRLHRAGRGLSTRAGSAAGRLRCPHCGHFLAVEEDGPAEVSCPSCGSSFKVSATALSGAPGEIPERIGRFAVDVLLGRGAFGAVYKAHDEELDRPVAVKVPRAGYFGTREEEERFLREARSAARLRHPGIVQVHEVGFDRGVPFIVSEYIPCRTLAELIAGSRPSFRESAQLVAEIAGALDFAHGQDVIHRDIKPGNILIDASGRPHVSDFGLARRGDEDVTVTLEGQILGTPAYMAPEQAAGDQDRIGPRSDQYGLGVVLYELLTGERPFRGSKSMLIHQVIHEEPRPPSSLNDHVPRDLETICLKAMSKDPARRYPTARALAEDMGRFLRHEPIEARPVGRSERLLRWTRRNPALAGMGLTVVSVLAVTAVVSATMAVITSRARDEANESLIRLNVAAGSSAMRSGDVLGALPRFANALRLERGGAAAERAHRTRIASVLESCPRLLRIWFLDGPALHAELGADGASVLTVSDGSVEVWSTAGGHLKAAFREGAPFTRAAFDPAGRAVVTASSGGFARVWAVEDGRPLTPPLSHAGSVAMAAFSPDGLRLVTACVDGNARAWLVETGEPLGRPMAHGAGLRSAVFSPDGSRILTAGADGAAMLWSAGSGEPAIPAPMRHARPIHDCAFSPDGSLLATASADQTAQVWDARTGEKVGPPLQHDHQVTSVAWSGDGRSLATASMDSTARTWDARTGELLLGGLRHPASLHQVRFSPDATRIVTAVTDGSARVWDAFQGDVLYQPLAHSRPVRSASFHPDGRRVLTASADGTVKLWDTASGPRLAVPFDHAGVVWRAAFSPDGTKVLTASADTTARIWDAATGEPLCLLVHDQDIQHATFSRDGSRVATASMDGSARVWDAATGRCLLPPLRHEGWVYHVTFGAGGRCIATAGSDHTARIWSGATGESIGGALRHEGQVTQVELGPDESRLLSTSVDATARVWDVSTGAEIRRLEHGAAVRFGLFSPDGARIATGCDDGYARLWDAAGGSDPIHLLPHRHGLTSVSFSPDGGRLLTSSYDGTARIWRVESGEPLGLTMTHDSLVQHASFSPDGLLVVTSGYDTIVRVWDAATGEALMPGFRHALRVVQAVFSPDGKRVLSSSYDGTARLWRLPEEERPLADLEALAHLLSSRRIDARGGHVPIEKEDLRALWEGLRSRYPEDLGAPEEDVRGWHLREALDAEAARHWAAMEEHLGPLIEAGPRRSFLHARRGHARALRGDWAGAAQDFGRAVELGSDEIWHHHLHALLLLKMGDLEGYRGAARLMAGRFGDADGARALGLVSWTAVLAPGALEDPEVAVAIARRAIDRTSRRGFHLNTLAAAVLRAGRWEEAISVLDEAVASDPRREGVAHDWVLYAMAHARLGRADEARMWLEKSRSDLAAAGAKPPRGGIVQNPWNDRVELEILIAEAASLLGER